MWLDPSGSVMNNEGPHCRNCHTGASSCNQCHGVGADGSANPNFGLDLLLEGKSIAAGDAFAHTVAVTDVAGECLDGGFSFPHRTLGANLLKDELYGVDFDGSIVNVGEARSVASMTSLSASWSIDNYPFEWSQSVTTENATVTAGAAMVWESGEQLDGVAAENMDSVCIDCHGDATTWNGDDPAYQRADGAWELLWKGLP